MAVVCLLSSRCAGLARASEAQRIVMNVTDNIVVEEKKEAISERQAEQSEKDLL